MHPLLEPEISKLEAAFNDLVKPEPSMLAKMEKIAFLLYSVHLLRFCIFEISRKKN